MINRVRKYIDLHKLLPVDTRVLVGVSGGIDSMVLLTILDRLGYDVRAVHVNYGLRGDESDKDQQLVVEYCEKRGISCTVFDASQAVHGRSGDEAENDRSSILEKHDWRGGIQQRARVYRYAAFEEVSTTGRIEVVAVGHHKNDQAETVLMNLQRGTGLNGLAGMRVSRPISPGSSIRLIRPLLNITRAEIEHYAKIEKIPWREDRSNRSSDYNRSVIRFKVLPLLQAGEGVDPVARLAEIAERMTRFLDLTLPGALPGSLHFEETDHPAGGGSVPVAALLELNPAVRGWLFLRMMERWIPGAPRRESTVDALNRLVRQSVGKRIQYTSGAVWKERDSLRFISNKNKREENRTILFQVGDPVQFEGGILTSAVLPYREPPFSENAYIVNVDRASLSGQLSIRRWESGDRLQPLGMRGTRKVKAVLTDAKVPSSEKQRIPVLCDAERIVWIVGHRLADGYRIRAATNEVVRFEYQPG